MRFAGLSDDEARAGMIQRGPPAFYADALIEVNRAHRHGDANRLTITVSDSTGLPPVGFAEFVRDHHAGFG